MPRPPYSPTPPYFTPLPGLQATAQETAALIGDVFNTLANTTPIATRQIGAGDALTTEAAQRAVRGDELYGALASLLHSLLAPPQPEQPAAPWDAFQQNMQNFDFGKAALAATDMQHNYGLTIPGVIARALAQGATGVDAAHQQAAQEQQARIDNALKAAELAWKITGGQADKLGALADKARAQGDALLADILTQMRNMAAGQLNAQVSREKAMLGYKGDLARAYAARQPKPAEPNFADIVQATQKRADRLFKAIDSVSRAGDLAFLLGNAPQLSERLRRTLNLPEGVSLEEVQNALVQAGQLAKALTGSTSNEFFKTFYRRYGTVPTTPNIASNLIVYTKTGERRRLPDMIAYWNTGKRKKIGDKSYVVLVAYSPKTNNRYLIYTTPAELRKATVSEPQLIRVLQEVSNAKQAQR